LAGSAEKKEKIRLDHYFFNGRAKGGKRSYLDLGGLERKKRIPSSSQRP